MVFEVVDNEDGGGVRVYAQTRFEQILREGGDGVGVHGGGYWVCLYGS